MKKVLIVSYGGGNDKGSVKGNVVEKDIMLELSKYISNKLKRYGISTLLVRDSDINMSIDDRIKIINNEKADSIVISNELIKDNRTGIDIIYSLGSNDLLAKDLYNSFYNDGFSVNEYYQKRYDKDTSLDYDQIIRDSNKDVIIIRYGNLNNSEDFNNLNNNLYKLGDSVVSAILNYFGINSDSDSNTYIVQKGDTLYSISRKFNISVEELKKINNLNSNLLNINQVLYISNSDNSNNIDNKYIVVKGDTLYSISRRFNISVSDLKKYNNLTNDLLSVGQIIYIPDNYINYVVVKGDSLYSISKKYNTTVDIIKNINNLNSNLLSIGQTLKIPK